MAEQKKVWVDGPFALISGTRSGAKVSVQWAVSGGEGFSNAQLTVGRKQTGTKLTGAKAMAAEMTIVHNGVIRGANAIYNQALGVAERGTDQDKIDFANFAFQWTTWVDEHHDFEETTLFPLMNEAAGVEGLMDGNVREHEAFHGGLMALEEYLTQVKEGNKVLDGQELKNILDGFFPTLHKHLEAEIDTLLALEKYDTKVDWMKLWDREVDKMIKGFMAKQEYRVSYFPSKYPTVIMALTAGRNTGQALPSGIHQSRQGLRERRLARVSTAAHLVRLVAAVALYEQTDQLVAVCGMRLHFASPGAAFCVRQLGG
jgi:hemerythrin-like domain-containing protein